MPVVVTLSSHPNVFLLLRDLKCRLVVAQGSLHPKISSIEIPSSHAALVHRAENEMTRAADEMTDFDTVFMGGDYRDLADLQRHASFRLGATRSLVDAYLADWRVAPSKHRAGQSSATGRRAVEATPKAA